MDRDATQAVTIEVATIVDSLPPAFTSGPPSSPVRTGTSYSHTFTASGNPPPTFSVTAGILPPGLALEGSSGVLSGTPTTPGSYTFTVMASNGLVAAVTQAVTIEVRAAVYLPLVRR